MLAWMVMGYEPATDVVPLNVAVPLPLSMKLTPVGRGPISDRVGVGEPEAVTVKLPKVPAVKVVPPPLEIAGA